MKVSRKLTTGFLIVALIGTVIGIVGIFNLIKFSNDQQVTYDQCTMAEGIFGTDLEGICTFCNASCLRLLGFEHTQDMLGKEIRSLIRHSYRDGTLRSKSERPLTEYLTAGMAGQPVEDVFWRAGGGCFDAEWRAMPRLKNGRRDGFVVTFTDITVRKQEEEKILFLSCHDAMTGLENRRCFEHVRWIFRTYGNTHKVIRLARLSVHTSGDVQFLHGSRPGGFQGRHLHGGGFSG